MFNIINSIVESYTNSGFVKFFFLFPVLFNMIVYPIHIWYRVKRDREAVLANDKYYNSFCTIGELFKYLFLTFLPVLNALDVIFHSGPIAWKYITEKLAWLFEIKLVKDTRKKDK